MSSATKPGNTANGRITSTGRSTKVRHEASGAKKGSRADVEAGVHAGPETLLSVKANRRIHYGPDASGPKTTFELRFRTSFKRTICVEVDSTDLLKPPIVLDKVIDKYGLFASDTNDLQTQIGLCRQMVVPDVVRTNITGWRGEGDERAFVTPGQSFGPGRAGFEFAVAQDQASADGQVGDVKGDLNGWRENVGQFLEMSSVGRFLLGVALAAPLLKAAGLSESSIFLLAGASTIGKSTLLKGVSSFQGSAAPVNPRASDRRFNELAAKHNGLLFVIGDLSQLNRDERRRVLHWLVMDATAGQPRSVSRTMRATLPDLPFETIAALSAEQTSAEIAEGVGARQLIGEKARCFDLVPGRGGYFDKRPKRGRLKPEKIAARINDGVVGQHGSGLQVWIDWLCSKSSSWLERRVRELIDEFVKKADPDETMTSLERRAAKKFGLTYAGLVLGRKAGVTTLSRQQAFKSVRRCLRRAMVSTAATSPETAVAALKAALRAPDAMLRSFRGGEQVKADVEANPDWLAVDTKKKGKRMIGIRTIAVRKALGDANAQVAFDRMVQNGQLRMPKGKDRWQKKIPGVGKIRLLELQPDWLDRDR